MGNTKNADEFTKNYVVEYYCQTDNHCVWSGTPILCPNGCLNGACIPENNTCTDSDNGFNVYSKGNVTTCINSQCNSTPDICIDQNILSERFCENTLFATTTNYTCPNGCNNGACIQEVQNQTACKDTDTGINYDLKGTCYDSYSYQTGNSDLCSDKMGNIQNVDESTKNYVVEYYCQTDNHCVWSGTPTLCPNGCLNGACQIPCPDSDNDSVCDNGNDSCIGQNQANIPANTTCTTFSFNTTNGCHKANYKANGYVINQTSCDYLDTQCRDYTNATNTCDGLGAINYGICGSNYNNRPISTQCATDYTNYSCYFGNTLGSDIGKIFVDYHCDGIGSCNPYPGNLTIQQDCTNTQYCNNITSKTTTNQSTDFTCATCTDNDNDQVCDVNDSCIGQNQANLPSNTSCFFYDFNQTNGCHAIDQKPKGHIINNVDCDYLDTDCADYTDAADTCNEFGEINYGICNMIYYQPDGYVINTKNCDSLDTECRDYVSVNDICDGSGNQINQTCGTNFNDQPNSTQCATDYNEYSCAWGNGFGSDTAIRFVDFQCDGLGACVNTINDWAIDETCTDAEYCEGQNISLDDADYYCLNCNIICNQNSQCDDSNPLTIDSCLNPGICASQCQNVICQDLDNDQVCDSNDLCNGENQSNMPLNTTCTSYDFNQTTGCHIIDYKNNGFVINNTNCDYMDTQCRDYTNITNTCDGNGNYVTGTCGTNYNNQPTTNQCGADYTNYSCYWGNTLGSDIGKIFVDYHCDGIGSCNAYPGNLTIQQDCTNTQQCGGTGISQNLSLFSCQTCADTDNDQVCDVNDSCIGQNQANMPANTTCTNYVFNLTSGCHVTQYKTNGYVINQTSCDYLDTQCRDYTNATNTCNGAGTLIYGICGANYANQPINTQCGNDSTHYSCYWGNDYGSDIGQVLFDSHCNGIGSCTTDINNLTVNTDCSDTQSCFGPAGNTTNSNDYTCLNCQVNCSNNIDCNDNYESTIDTCNLPSTCASYCSHAESNLSENDAVILILSLLPADKIYEQNQSMYFGGKTSEIKKDILAYWTFDETTGNVAEMNGRYNLTQTGQMNSSAGIISNSRGSYADNAYFTHPTLLDNGIPGSGSISLWFNTPAGEGDDVMMLFNKDPLMAMGHFRCYLLFSGTDMSGNLYKAYCWMKNDDSLTYLVSPGYVQRNSWNHLVFNFGPSGQKMYLNNQLAAQNTVTDSFLGTSERDFTVGAIQGQEGTSFNGLIDEFGIWNRNLNEEEISHLYNNGNATRTTEKIMINDTGVGQINRLDIKSNWQYNGKTKIAYFEYESTADSLNPTDSSKVDAYPNRYIPFIYKINKGNSTQITAQINLIMAEINSRE